MKAWKSQPGWTLMEDGKYGERVRFTTYRPDGTHQGPVFEVCPCTEDNAKVMMQWDDSTQPVTTLECTNYGAAYMYALAMCSSNAFVTA